ncbi:hypothetical protein EYC84_008973 [Monilinia fructicola]|uniref:Uncharacterized protein n=1 Tax=Monilinia fructicola TaxID=38448 RepID=A0A5M9JH25_MONFR|nr:hypothetical protein EYC84_008973 [Monilinia fructicola]
MWIVKKGLNDNVRLLGVAKHHKYHKIWDLEIDKRNSVQLSNLIKWSTYLFTIISSLSHHIQVIYAAMVTSTSTPASMLMMICLTTSVGALRLFCR